MLNKTYIVTEGGLEDVSNVSHNVLVSDGNTIYYTRTCKSQVKDMYAFPITINALWIGDIFDVVIKPHDTKQLVTKKKMSIYDWSKFFGMWAMTGSVTSKRDGLYRKITINSQIDIDDHVPFAFQKTNHKYEIYNTQVAEYLKQFGDKTNRRLDPAIKEGTTKSIKTFINWFKITLPKNKTTKSWGLVEDLFDLFAKVNYPLHVDDGYKISFVSKPDIHHIRTNICTDMYVYLVINGDGGWYRLESG